MTSQQVSWWTVHEHVKPILDAVRTWPAAGTPAWTLLADNDLRKIAALLDAAQHWCLRVETCQQALADAAKNISGGTAT